MTCESEVSLVVIEADLVDGHCCTLEAAEDGLLAQVGSTRGCEDGIISIVESMHHDGIDGRTTLVAHDERCLLAECLARNLRNLSNIVDSIGDGVELQFVVVFDKLQALVVVVGRFAYGE